MRKYVIVRKPIPAQGDNRTRGVEVLGSGGRSPQFSFERLSAAQAVEASADPAVRAVVPAMPTTLIRPKTKAGFEGEQAWGLDAIGARESGFTGRGVTVAVLDTGIDASHPAFADVELEQRDFSGDGDGDVQGHGTHCAGTIFGRDIEGTRIGVAPGVSRALIGKVLNDVGGGDSEMIVEGIQWALAEGANIISMSLGFDFPGMVAEWTEEGWPVELATSKALEAFRVNLRMFDATMNSTRARGGLGGGALVIAAAGNESRREDHPEWRIAASLPAAAEDVVSVAAVGRNGEDLSVAGFSNSMAVVSGPGVGIVSAKAGGGLETLSGTSMACPHVAGIAALWWEAIKKQNRSATPTNVRAKLISTARRNLFARPAEIDIGEGLVTAP